MKEVCLLSLEQAGILVLENSGVIFWSKTGNTDPQFRAEGVFVPISNDPPLDQPELALVPRLQSVFKNTDRLTPSAVRDLDELLYEVSSSDAISVNTVRMNDSSVGWVYLSIRPEGDFSYFVGFDEAGEGKALQGVLVWPCGA